MQSRFDKQFRMEEMLQLLIRILGKSNEKISELEQRQKQLETEIWNLRSGIKQREHRFIQGKPFSG